jgi:hypothetical protein
MDIHGLFIIAHPYIVLVTIEALFYPENGGRFWQN